MGILVIGTLIIIIAFVFNRITNIYIDKPSPDVEGIQQEITASSLPGETPAPTTNPSPTHPPALSSSPAAKPTSTPQPPANYPNILDFKYPASNIISQSSSTLLLESENSTDDITSWYEDKIKSYGFNVKTFIKTKANEKVLNKLAGAKNDLEILIEISKENEQSMVKIKVSIN